MKKEYMPSPAEFKRAKESMTDEQKKMSDEREATLIEGEKRGIEKLAKNAEKVIERSRGRDRLNTEAPHVIDHAVYLTEKANEASRLKSEYGLSQVAENLLADGAVGYNPKDQSLLFSSYYDDLSNEKQQAILELLEKLPNIKIFGPSGLHPDQIDFFHNIWEDKIIRKDQMTESNMNLLNFFIKATKRYPDLVFDVRDLDEEEMRKILEIANKEMKK